MFLNRAPSTYLFVYFAESAESDYDASYLGVQALPNNLHPFHLIATFCSGIQLAEEKGTYRLHYKKSSA